ncbi:MAG: hypothetical protein HUU46_03345 [Candidatus Hydrogenedentes bacterium]|nr:hypothetical protein [Candidatus Hydrogenedentota bacterium]
MITPRIALGLLGLVLLSPAGDHSKELHPIVVLTGSASGIEKPENLRLTSQDEWEPVWKRHRANQTKPGTVFDSEQTPVIDFANYMLIAVFLGATWNMEGIKVVDATDSESETTIRLDLLTYQTGPSGDRVSPYVFIVMPLSRKPIVLQRDARTLPQRAVGPPPIWEEFHRFDALPESR